MAADPADLWQPEANKAISDWSSQFDPKRLEILYAPGARQSSNTYGTIGAEAKRAFDDVASTLLERVRDLLTRCNNLDQIGAPELVAKILADPLERKARDAIPNASQVANLGFTNTGLLEGILGQPKQQIREAAAILRSQLQNEVLLRREQIDGATHASRRRLENDLLGDFVRLGKTALDEGHKDVAAVLAAAALEDCLKRLALRHSINVEGKTMQDIVGALKGQRLVGGAQKYMLDTMPKLRDYAMHAEWNKIDAASVSGMLGFVEQFLVEHFS
jgi:hypothetical protein